MKLLYKLKDNEFPLTEITHTRACARAIILNEKNQVCMIHVYGDDIFGHRDYYETPGGGVDLNELPREAVLREAMEEVGVKAEVISEIGIVDDYYNLIKRNNLNYYYLLKVKDYCDSHQEEFERIMFKEIIWVSIDEAIKIMEATVPTPISRLVINRELPIYKIVKEMLENK